jgi:hypothetical protein
MDTFLPGNGTLKRSQTLTISTNLGSKFDALTLNAAKGGINYQPPPTNMSDENSGSLSSSSSTSSSISSNSSSPSMIYANNKLLSSTGPVAPQQTVPNQPCLSLNHTSSFTLSRNASFSQRRGSVGGPDSSRSSFVAAHKRKENEISSLLYNAEFSNLNKPTPPSRTSSLRYKFHEPPRPVSSIYNNSNICFDDCLFR